eukprot:SAG31_NODE_339_length_17487_cov_20.764435_9_plen_440_part_00
MSVGLVTTVLGPVPANELGLILPHEHLIFDIGQWSGRDDNVMEDADVAAEELRLFRLAGGGTVCDVTPLGLGRDVAALKKASAASGTHVVSGLGIYSDFTWPEDFRQATEHGKVQMLMDAADATCAAFFGEIATHNEPHGDWRRYALLKHEEEMLRAVGRAAVATGRAISTHASMGRAGIAQLSILAGNPEVDMRRVIIGHCDTVAHRDASLDYDYYHRILHTGATVEFDLFGWGDEVMKAQTAEWLPDGCMQERDRLDRLVGLVEQGWAQQLVISSDTCRKSQMASHGGRGLTFVLDRTVRELRARGVSASDIDAMTRTNMRRLLAQATPRNGRRARQTDGAPATAPAAGHGTQEHPELTSNNRCRSAKGVQQHQADAVGCDIKRQREAKLHAMAMRLGDRGELLEVEGRPWWTVSCPFCPIGGMLPPSRPPSEPAHL